MVQVEAAWLVSKTLCSWSNHVSVSVSMFCRSNYDVILIVQIILWLPVIIYRTHILWSWDCTVGFWGEAIFQELRMFINIQEVSHWYVPGVTCMLPVEAFATGVKIFKQQEVCLIVHSKGLERLILYGSKVELELPDLDHLIFTVWRLPLSLWLAFKKGFGRLIQFWSWSQMLLLGTYKWLPLVFCYQDQNGINVHFIKGSK